MLTIFILSLSLLFYVFFGYPLALYFLSWFLRKEPQKSEALPTVSLIISAYNEQDIIADKLKNTLHLNYPSDKLEVIIASESTDKTNEIVGQFADKGFKLQSFEDRAGKAATLFRTVPHAHGEILIFSDANAMYEADAIQKLVRNFADKRIGCVSGQLQYDNLHGTGVGMGEGFYWKYEMLIKIGESRLFSLLGANGSIFALRKNLYLPMAYERGDDFELPVKVALQGFGVILEPEAISREKSCERPADEFKRKARIIAWNTKSAFLLLKESAVQKKPLLFFQILSHKILRWFFPFFAAGLFISSLFLGAGFFRAVLLLQIAFYILGLAAYMLENAGIKVPKVLVVPHYFCLMMAGAFEGLRRLLFTRQKTVWEKVRA